MHAKRSDLQEKPFWRAKGTNLALSKYDMYNMYNEYICNPINIILSKTVLKRSNQLKEASECIGNWQFFKNLNSFMRTYLETY